MTSSIDKCIATKGETLRMQKVAPALMLIQQYSNEGIIYGQNLGQAHFSLEILDVHPHEPSTRLLMEVLTAHLRVTCLE